MSDTILPPAPAVESTGSTQIPVHIEDEMRASYLDYAMSVIIGRALPDVRDGLKPVHRRVLFAMQDLGNTHQRSYKKSARIVGDVIGKYHPHGDQAVYDTLVRMAQQFSMRHVLVDGQGNFGSIDGDPPAAMRYTEVRMTKLSAEMLADIDKDTVHFSPNYDGSLEEPNVLPCRFPNLLINGSSGIAVGMATNIPPHNLAEVIDATLALIEDPQLEVSDLMKYVPGPDFPTGGIIYGTHNLRQGYETGRGVIQVRGLASFETTKRNERIIIHEIPYMVNKTSLIEKIAALIKEKRLEGISDLRDESDRDGMRVVIELKRDANAEIVLNQLYANTTLQSSFGFNMLAIVHGAPKVLSLKAILQHFINHRRDVVLRRSRFELKEAQTRFHIVFGLLAAIYSIEKIIAIIRSAKDAPEAKQLLMHEKLTLNSSLTAIYQDLLIFPYESGEQALKEGFLHLNEPQAQAILEMRLARLTGLEQDKLSLEAKTLADTIARLLKILNSEQLLLQVISQELLQIRENYQEPRRTKFLEDARQISKEDLIADEEMVITVSHAGYVKRNPIHLYQAQNRGGRGKTAVTTREEDFVERIFVASSHADVLVFSDKGKVYWLKVYEIPQAGRSTRGKPIVNLIRLDPEERIAAVLPVRQFLDGQYIVMLTQKGIIKKTELQAFKHPRPSGLIALSIDDDDALIRVAITDGNQDIFVATRQGLAVRFPESAVRAMGRTARGVRAIHLKHEGDMVVGMVICSKEIPEVLTVCDNGYGKRTPMEEYRLQGRSGSGIINCKTSERNGLVASVCGISPEDEVMVITNRGMMIRMKVNQISLLGRSTQGVKIIHVEANETVQSVARIAEGSLPATEAVLDGDASAELLDSPTAETEL